MAIEPIFEKLSLITKKTECESFIDLSEKAGISTESIEKVLSVSVFPTVSDGNISNEKLTQALEILKEVIGKGL